MTARHFLVIGAGIVGVSVARHLQLAGQRVSVIDRLGPGEGASKGNASVIATESCIPVATPGILSDVPRMLLDPLGPLAIRWRYLPRLAPWLIRFLAASRPQRVEAISIALRNLLTLALAAHKELLADLAMPQFVRETGWLTLFESEERFRDYRWDLDLQRRRGVEFRELTGDAIRDFEPSLEPIYRHGVYYPENSYITDNFALVRALAERIVAAGGQILRDEIQGFAMGPAGPNLAIGRAGRYPADAIILAAGAWSKPLARQLGHGVPLDTERGYHVTLPQPGKMPRLPLYSGDHSFAVTPLSCGLRLAGTVELGGLAAPPNFARAEKLMRHARRMFGAIDETGRSDWMGYRPSLPDSLPVIARGRRFANTFFAFGHGHLGLTLGPLTGRLIADLALDRDPGLSLLPYRIDRF